jgi:hypothetical protein
MENEVPPPFRIVTIREHYDVELTFYGCILSDAVRYFLA